MNQTPVAAYGRYAQVTIVRVDSDSHTPREYGDRFYILVDRNNQQLSRSFRYLRNARRQAGRIARTLDLYCRCGHCGSAHNNGNCLPRVGVTCLCAEFRETRSNMAQS